MPPVVGYAVTATIRCSTPPPVGHVYADRTDWWNDILKTPAPRVVVVQDVDIIPGLGAFVGEVHANILRALKCVAYVTNGAVRDLPAVRASGLQLFAACTSPSHAFVHILSFGEPVTVAGLDDCAGRSAVRRSSRCPVDPAGGRVGRAIHRRRDAPERTENH